MNDRKNIYVIDDAISYDDYVPIDLSVDNTELAKVRLDDPEAFGSFIENYLKQRSAKAAFGGYNEIRDLYRTSSIFKEVEIAERDVHIGIDIWTHAGTSVLAAFDGIVHSFANNTGKGNYGPTIILQHHNDNEVMHTLYGHLSVDSIADIQIGDAVRQGNKIGELGDASVNGGYPPHLHFQLIRDVEGNSGDYPGVCSRGKLDFYLQNCPDPNTILKIRQ